MLQGLEEYKQIFSGKESVWTSDFMGIDISEKKISYNEWRKKFSPYSYTAV